ncbi:MAG: GGDEF domain-containing protein [Candidatus Woesearchaeota archaeon]
METPLRRKSDLLGILRRQVHLAEGVEESLDAVLHGLKDWGYHYPRIYRYRGDETYSLIAGIDLPDDFKEARFKVSSNKLLEDVINTSGVYVRKEVSPLLIGGEEDPLNYILSNQEQNKGFIAVPYTAFSKTYTQREIKGVIAANFDPENKEIDSNEELILEDLGRIVGGKVARLLENRLLAKKTEELERLNEKLTQQIKIDGPTGMFNKKTFHEDLEYYLEDMKRNKDSYFLIMLDCDGLKGLNDSYGHPEGDKFISALGEYLRSVNDKTVAGYRVGGDEFAVVVKTKSHRYVADLAEKIRQKIKEIPVPTGYRPITFSVGTVEAKAEFKDGEEWYDAGDTALYGAKGCRNKTLRYLTGGGDRIRNYDETQHTLIADLRSMLRDNVHLYRAASAIHKKYVSKFVKGL